ncbi:MAG: SDR family oxidoreductase, partial [Candidatus Hydrogenedentes bacterium]|nr:SDR family oxidoreductase [Candidatus Hydrogenedentota bacterium]
MGEPAKPTLVIAGDAAGTLSGRLARLRLSGEQYACEACPDYDEAGRRLEALAASGVPVGACFATPGGADGQQARFLDTAAAGHPLAPRVLVAEKGAGRLHRVLNDGHRLDRFVPLDCTDADLELALDSILARHRSLARLSAETRGRIGRHLFITGATGFLGLRLVRDLLLCTDARLTLFVRNAARLAIDVHDFPGRVEVLEGDMAAPDLGLPGPARAALAESVD